jgi:hypothetical protein
MSLLLEFLQSYIYIKFSYFYKIYPSTQQLAQT